MSLLHYVKSSVVRGFGRGSKQLGCPTANMDNIGQLSIPTGIYCGLAQLVIHNKDQIQREDENHEEYEVMLKQLPYVSPVHGMVCSFGYNPQFANKEKSLEVNILDDYQFNFYGAELRVLICKKLRDEAKYDGIEELKEAIANDIKNARGELRNFSKLSSNSEYFVTSNTKAA